MTDHDDPVRAWHIFGVASALLLLGHSMGGLVYHQTGLWHWVGSIIGIGIMFTFSTVMLRFLENRFAPPGGWA